MDRPDLDQHWAANLTFGDLPGEAARHFGDREALCFRDRRYSFRQISLEVDRLARGFKVGGENVDPMEVEGHLLRHPAVHQVAVVGYPDARLTEVAVAFVIPKEGAAITAEALIAACRGRIASFKIPRHVFLVEDLPTTSSGKIRKVDLREQALRLLGG